MLASIDKKDLILNAATALFARYGFTKTSVEEIANQAGIGKATIYYYFPSKEEIFLEAMQIKAEEFFALLINSIGACDRFEDKLAQYTRLPVKYVGQHMPMLGEALHAMPHSYHDRVMQLYQRNRKRMNDILKDIIELGIERQVLADDFCPQHFSQIINDWFLFSEPDLAMQSKDSLIQRIERDHDYMINMILYGIIKRG